MLRLILNRNFRYERPARALYTSFALLRKEAAAAAGPWARLRVPTELLCRSTSANRKANRQVEFGPGHLITGLANRELHRLSPKKTAIHYLQLRVLPPLAFAPGWGRRGSAFSFQEGKEDYFWIRRYRSAWPAGRA